jgi:hypothetical protein
VAKPAPGIAQDEPSPPTSRVARMLALAYAIERSVEAGDIRDYAAAAAALGSTLARMSQILDLRNLAPRLQEAIIAGELAVSERELRAVVRDSEWDVQAGVLGS